MTRTHLLSILGLGLATATASAAPPLPENLLECINRGFGLQKCKLVDAQLGDALVEDGQTYEGTQIVHYDFPCTGHSVQLGVKVGDGTKFFTMNPAGDAVITVNGTGELRTFDPSPEVTRTLTFNTACKLKVTGVTLLPSTTTIQIWTLQAQDQRRIKDLAEQRFLIAQDFENLSAWNVDKLTNLKERLDDLVAGTPSNINYKIMRDAVVSAINGQPPSATLDELRNAGLDVIAVLQGELEEEVAKIQNLIDRFARWELAIPPILQG